MNSAVDLDCMSLHCGCGESKQLKTDCFSHLAHPTYMRLALIIMVRAECKLLPTVEYVCHQTLVKLNV